MYLVFKGSIYKVLMWIHSWISTSVHEVWQMNVLILDNKWGPQHPLGIPVGTPNITWESHLGVPTSLGNPTWESQHLLGIPVGTPNITWESHLGVPTSLGNPHWESQHPLGIPLILHF